MHKRTKVCTAVLVALSGAAALTSAPAFAQTTLERVEITGSSVRRIDAETALPVQIIKKEDIARTGATSVVDLLQKLPAIQGSFSDSNSVGGSSPGNALTVSIHNIGDTRTLVLLNGHRITQHGGQTLTGFAAAVDLNTIPIGAIERVEILTDGASALYGADAVAGVVNFITKRYSTDGDVTIGVSYPRGGGGKETRISANKGFGDIEKDGFNVQIAFSHDERTQLNATDRNFGKEAVINFKKGSKSYRATNITPSAIPGNILADNEFELRNLDLLAGGDCPDKTFRVTTPYRDDTNGDGIDEDLVDDYCAFNFVAELEIYPVRKRDTFMATVNKKIGDQELFADVLIAQSKSTSRIAPVPGSIFIPLGSPLHDKYLLPNGFAGGDLLGDDLNGEDVPGLDGVRDGNVIFYRLYDLGKRTSNHTSKVIDIALGSKGNLFGWDYTAAYTHSESEAKESLSGYPGAKAVGRLRASGALDPFVGPGQQSAAGLEEIKKAAYKGYWDGGTAKLDTLSLRGSRELMQMASGPLLLGTGISYQTEKFQSKPSLFAQGRLADPVAGTLCAVNADGTPGADCDQRFGDEAATQPYGADRKSFGIFGELVIPVTKTLEATGSLRYDDYSDFGNATTAKAAFRWTPTKGLLVRGSVGTGFKAPTVPQVNATLQPYGVTGSEYACSDEMRAIATELGARCRPGEAQYDQYAGGNKNLKPEKSKQASLGIRIEPSSQFSAGADLWHVNIRDSIGQVTEEQVFANPNTFRSLWSSKVDTGTGVNYLAWIAGNENLGRSYATGLDLDLIGRGKLGPVDLTSQVALTYMIREVSQLTSDGPFYSAIGNHAELGTVTFRWQGRWTNTFTIGNFANTFQINFKSGYRDAETEVEVLDAAGNVTGFEDLRLKVKKFATLDWQTVWTPRKDLSLTVGALNLFDTKPPFVISSGGTNRGQQFGFDDRYYDSRGRTLYANASYKF
jgi:iron complex outermembrane receptor protein